MNSSGMIRGIYSKNVNSEIFLEHVLKTIEKQLKKWDNRSEVESYHTQSLSNISVYFLGETYELSLSKEKIERLQGQSSYSLDKHIWTSLTKEGLILRYTEGNYLSYVLR